MKDNLFLDYSRKHVHFYDESIPVLLERGLSLVTKCRETKPALLDLGCGDGRLLFALYRKGILTNFACIVGVDISKERIERLRKELPFIKGIISDALNVKELPICSFDFIICLQLIEHVKDDHALVSEIKRLLKDGGLRMFLLLFASGMVFIFMSKTDHLGLTLHMLGNIYLLTSL